MPELKNIGEQPCQSGRFYRIKEGETLKSIATKVGIPLEELTSLNPQIDPENLQPGNLLCLPGERPCPSGVFWEIAAGDTLYNIALTSGTTVESIMAVNPFIDPMNLQIGQILCMPE